MKDQHRMYQISTQILNYNCKERPLSPTIRRAWLCCPKQRRLSLLSWHSFPWIYPLSPIPLSSIQGHQQLSDEKFLSSKCSVWWTVWTPQNFIKNLKNFLIDLFPGIQERDIYSSLPAPTLRQGQTRSTSSSLQSLFLYSAGRGKPCREAGGSCG